jgi:short-subunit dehydrogenase
MTPARRAIVAITGASSGIGAAFARKLAGGHDLLLIARRKDRLEALADELEGQFDCNVEVLPADLTEEYDTAGVAERIQSESRLALLINNAGFGTKGRFWQASLKGQEQMHKLHVMATMHLTHAALNNMVPRDFGGIVNVASVAAFVRSPGSVSYCATKSWMTVFTEGIHLELRGLRSNVTVQALCPGFTYSEFHDVARLDRSRVAPKGFWMTADEIVDASLNGLRRRKLFVVPGWRYRLLTAIVSKLPASARVALEGSVRRPGRLSDSRPPQQIPDPRD